MNDPREDLKAVIEELKRRLKTKEIPDRQLVRLAFLALGRICASEGKSAAGPLAKELAEAAAPHDERWMEAIESEMSLAVAEHIHSVDPKYLSLPSYDFAYTVAARERLEQRLRAAELLHVRVSERLLDQIAGADTLLQPYLERD